MRRRRLATILLVLLALLVQGGVAAAAEPLARSYIVVFRDSAVSAPVATSSAAVIRTGDTGDSVRTARGARRIEAGRVMRRVTDIAVRDRVRATNVFTNVVGGFSARLSPAQLRAIAADPAVATIMLDTPISLTDGLAGEPSAAGGPSVAAVKSTSSLTPSVPAGVRRVGATRSATAAVDGVDRRVSVDVAIVDTGVDPGHRDLNVAGGYNCTTANRRAWGDGHGHGTHVAGTVGALDDRRGVVGVAPGARLWSVKVLDSTGSGLLSWLVCGIDWVTAHRDRNNPSRPLIEVANMSISFGLPGADDRNCGIPRRDTLHMAICRSVAAGTVWVVAAGNEARDARLNRPGAYDEVITVSAMVDYDGKPGGLARQGQYCGFYSADGDDTFTDFSNYGREVDLTAPGKCVLSTYPNGRYAWMSGTSMATPHVAGGAALYLVRFANARPQQVRMALQHAGRYDWRTRTDPDGNPDPLLWVASFAPPPDYAMEVGAPTGWVNSSRGLAVAVNVSRINGHTEPLSLSLVDAPRGITGDGTVAGSRGTLNVIAAPGTPAGTYRVKVRASDGELVRSQRVRIRVEADAPTAVFTTPQRNSLTIQSQGKVDIAWRDGDTGSGISSRSLQRQRGGIVRPGSCDAVRWGDVGDALTEKRDYTQNLPTGYCFRWQLTVSDRAGNRTVATSGSVLVDATGPSAPQLVLVEPAPAAGVGLRLPAAYAADAGAIWFRGGVSGSMELLVRTRDSQSGISWYGASLSRSTGWGRSWAWQDDVRTLILSYGRSAGSTSLSVRSANGADLFSPTAAVSIRRDASAPEAFRWATPQFGSTTPAGTRFRLRWRGGGDDGSGLAAGQLVRRLAAPANRAGTCRNVTFAADSAARLVSNGAIERGLQAGYCYIWTLRAVDRVGNLGATVTSGVVLAGQP